MSEPNPSPARGPQSLRAQVEDQADPHSKWVHLELRHEGMVVACAKAVPSEMAEEIARRINAFEAPAPANLREAVARECREEHFADHASKEGLYTWEALPDHHRERWLKLADRILALFPPPAGVDAGLREAAEGVVAVRKSILIQSEDDLLRALDRYADAVDSLDAALASSPQEQGAAGGKVPEGFRPIEAYTDFKTVVLMGPPVILDGDNHNCDAMGCGSRGHVLARIPIPQGPEEQGAACPDCGRNGGHWTTCRHFPAWYAAQPAASTTDGREEQGAAERFPVGTEKRLGSILGSLEGCMDGPDRPEAITSAEVVIGQILADKACMGRPEEQGESQDLEVSVAGYNPKIVRFERGEYLATISLPTPEIASWVVSRLRSRTPSQGGAAA